MQNLVKVFDQAESEDHRMAARSWWTYNHLTSRMAEKFGFSPEVGAAVFAALSPNNDYHGNLRDAHRLLKAAHDGLELVDFKVSTYGANKRKAWAIAHGTPPLDVIVFPKTRSFFLNIRDPNDPQPVTVDGHIYNAWRGYRVRLNSAAVRFPIKLYEVIAEDVRAVARQAGLLPNVAQGVIWFVWRRIHGIKFQPQLELWCPETRAAGLGFEPYMKWSGWSESHRRPLAPKASALPPALQPV
jgi:hypothetical protein